MYLSKKLSEELIKLGFKRSHYIDEVAPFDIYYYEDTEWAVGGKIFPNSNLTSPEEVYKQGTWLPTTYDLLTWLEENNCVFSITNNGQGYKIEVTDSEGNIYKAKAGTSEHVLYNVIIKILQKHGGNPVNRKYEVIEAEFVSREDM